MSLILNLYRKALIVLVLTTTTVNTTYSSLFQHQGILLVSSLSTTSTNNNSIGKCNTSSKRRGVHVPITSARFASTCNQLLCSTGKKNYSFLKQLKSQLTTRLEATNDIATADEYYDDNRNDPNNNNQSQAAKKEEQSKDALSSSLNGIASYSKLIIFISTTIIIWLSEPLLSLVDTTVVGKFASASTAAASSSGISSVPLTTLQLAALGPATMVCDNAFYLVYFLAIAVTNQLASTSSSSNENDTTIDTTNSNPNLSLSKIKTTSHALGVASILGTIITFVIFTFGSSILKFIIGEGGAMVNGIDMTSSLITSSWEYTKIRGLLAPLTVMGMIAQAVCLATLDTKIPALAVVVASVMNVVGDMLLVARFKMGLRGAAVATALAGMGSSFVLLKEIRRKVYSWKDHVMMFNNSNNNYLDKVTDGNKKKKLPSFISLPDPMSFISLVKLAGPIFFVLLGKIICYSSMTLKATDFEMMSLATHNIMLRVFFFFCTFGDGFSLAAQSFLPQVLYGQSSSSSSSRENDDIRDCDEIIDDELKQPSQSDKLRAKLLLKRILLLASGMAVLNSSLTKIILQQGGMFFTNDSTILSLLRSSDRVFYMMGAVFLHPLIMAFEGSILATRDLGFLVASYGATMTILLSTLKFGVSTFTGVWKALFLFQVIRFVIFGSRVFKKTRIDATA